MADLYDQDAAFWKSYMEHRPFPPQWLWDRLWSYHAEHSSDFRIVHDGGAGSGVHSQVLGRKFDKVILSDPSASNIEEAKKHLSNQGDKTDYEFHVAKFEELHIEPDTCVDLVFLANVIHWTDQTKAHLCAANQLKPGGTYAIGLWWNACFPDHPKIHELCCQIMDEYSNQVAPSPEDSEKWLGWQAAAMTVYTGGASIVLPGEFSPDSVLRIEINREPTMTVHQDRVAEKKYDFKPSQSYRTEHIKDKKWICHTDFAGLMDRYATYCWDTSTPGMQKLIVPLKSEFEKAGGAVDGLWQASLLLATRR